MSPLVLNLMMIFFLWNVNFFTWFDIIEGLDVGFFIQYESISSDPIISVLILEKSKSEFLQCKTFVLIDANLDQTLEHINSKGLVDLGPTDSPRHLAYNDKISRLMTYLLANFKYVSLFDVWAEQCDKLKQTLTCAALMLQMYSFQLQLSNFYNICLIESGSSIFDKLLHSLMCYDLSRNFQFGMEWLVLHKFLDFQEGIAYV